MCQFGSGAFSRSTSKVTCKSFRFFLAKRWLNTPSPPPPPPPPPPPRPPLSSGQPDIHLNESLALCPGYWTADRTLLLVIVVLLVNIRRLNALTWTLGHKLHKVLFLFLDSGCVTSAQMCLVRILMTHFCWAVKRFWWRIWFRTNKPGRKWEVRAAPSLPDSWSSCERYNEIWTACASCFCCCNQWVDVERFKWY